MAGDWRRLHSEELHNLYTSPNIIRVIKSRRTQLGGGGEARLRDVRNAHNILVGKLEGGDHLEDLSVVEKIILDWISGKEGGNLWIGFIWLRIGTSSRLL
jgi:hypothetical protein